MLTDQAHKQNNMTIKSSGGGIDLTENSSAFRNGWFIPGPEQARILKEFEEEHFSTTVDSESDIHHEGFSAQKNFKEQASIVSSINWEIPFLMIHKL